MYQRFSNCDKFDDLIKLFKLPNINKMNTNVDKEFYLHNATAENGEILHSNNKYAQL